MQDGKAAGVKNLYCGQCWKRFLSFEHNSFSGMTWHYGICELSQKLSELSCPTLCNSSVNQSMICICVMNEILGAGATRNHWDSTYTVMLANYLILHVSTEVKYSN
jgi:hypothetical protein